MNIDLQNRLEKAAKQYATKVVPECISCYDEYFNDTVSDFRNGAEYGYKEAIAAAKEWMKNTDNFYQSGSEDYPDVTVIANTIEEMIDSFETDMNKLLEEIK